VKLPKEVPFEQAAFIEPLNTTLKGVRLLRLEPDETVLVIGQGPIGILLATLAKKTGAKVVTSDLYPQRHAVARGYGLVHSIDASKEDVVKRVREESEGRGADAVLLAVGGNALIPTAIEAARPGGRIMLFAQTQHGQASFDPAVVCVDEKTLMGSYSSSAEIQDEGVRMVVDGYTQGYDLTRLISHRFPLSRATEAIAFASEPHPDSMKIMIEPGS
jgi:L-iditol 2-dehydrogenase